MYAAAVFVGVIIIGSVYYSNIQKDNNAYTADNYESYVLSQVDESSMMDYYVNNK
jgi:hypothetical protein